MIDTGLVSVSFRKLTPEQIVALVAEAKLNGIEWGGDVHVPPGNIERAREVGKMTRDAALRVLAYGSYYRAGAFEAGKPTFESILETAVALGAPTIRVWAGNKASADADAGHRKIITDDLSRICTLAGQVKITISTEYHGGTLTDTNESAQQLHQEVNHQNLFTFWQPPNDRDLQYCLDGLKAMLSRVSNVHVFHWPRGSERHPLVEGESRWQHYLRVLKGDEKDHAALLEFVINDDPSQFLRDSATLKRWLAETGG